jgi:plasmid stabilization system protein ParE
MIIWNRRAETSLDKITDYIGENFSQKEEETFLVLVLETLTAIEEFPKAYPETKTPKGARKAVIHPHSTLFYRIESKKKIRLLFFWDNRKNPKKIK